MHDFDVKPKGRIKSALSALSEESKKKIGNDVRLSYLFDFSALLKVDRRTLLLKLNPRYSTQRPQQPPKAPDVFMASGKIINRITLTLFRPGIS